MKLACQICVAIACVAGFVEGTGFAAEQGIDYASQIKPLLRERCFACHGALKQEGGLRLDTAALMKQGGDSGAAIDPRQVPEKSYLIERVSDSDPSSRMPPEFEGEPLSKEQIELLKSWIAAGASAPADEVAEADPSQHWAFQPIKRPVVPEVANANWVRNPIDAWIAQGHERHGLTPQAEVSRLALLRRVTFDLIGLPPTAAEIEACLSDSSPDWYEKTVDRLLADPRHGERWARHWMDNWRYSDWWGLGNQLRNSQKHMWHWRDWIVESLNEDLPYDEMIRLMLAADELAPDDPDKLRATGLLARNYYIFNRTNWMDQTVEHVGKGFLGLTLNCSKCHDHKFDPISQVDYYRMRAFFEPYQVRLDMVPGEVDFDRNGIPRVFDGHLDAPTYRFIRGDDAQPDKSAVIAPGVPDLLAFDSPEIAPVELPPVAWQPARRPGILDSYLTKARQEWESSQKKVNEAEDALQRVGHAKNTDSPANSKEPFSPLADNFATFDDTRWERVSGDWAHGNGTLDQNMDGPKRSILQLRQLPPEDFDATLRFRIRGGSRYRSVGIAFDTTDSKPDAPTQQFVYASAFANDSKVQAAYSVEGQSSYPGDGRKSHRLELNRDYTLQVQVRGTLINASLDGEPMVAWRSPVARRQGSLQLFTFDALATLIEFTLAPLPESVELRSPGDSASPSMNPVAKAENDLRLAQARADVARANLESIQARMTAMQTEWDSTDASTIRDASIAAIRAERELTVAQATEAVVTAEIAMQQSAAEKKADAEKKLTSAQQELEKAKTQQLADIQESDSFTPLRGAEWSATRFLHTGKDDPQVAYPKQSTGRRTALAKWVTDRRNPLTARVAANHIWTRHFGQPLVASTFDFGRNGTPPAHPELLDWLASELMDHNWSMKHLHRLMVLSSTYRMGSAATGHEDQLAKDPDNHYWWRRVPIRMESQLVRDSILAHAGTLDFTMGGPSVAISDQESSHRRSLYFFHSNNERNLLLTTFDEASVSECYRREQSIVPQQALALTNSRLVLESSHEIASAISSTYPDDTDFIQQAFVQLLGLHADDDEVTQCAAALKAWQELPDGSSESARANLVWALINHNDFVTIR